MRLVMLAGTLLWMAKKDFAGSFGGTALDMVIAIVNLATAARMAGHASG